MNYCFLFRNSYYKEYLINTTSNWEWAVSWLNKKISESSFDSSGALSPIIENYPSSKKFNDNKTFHRTKSVQVIISIFLYLLIIFIFLSKVTLDSAIDLLGSDTLNTID